MTTCAECGQSLQWCSCPDKQGGPDLDVARVEAESRPGGAWVVRVTCEHGLVGASLRPHPKLTSKEAAIEMLLSTLPSSPCSCIKGLLQRRRERAAAAEVLKQAKTEKQKRTQPAGEDVRSAPSSGAVEAECS